MFKGKRLIGITLTILLVFSINGFTAYYKYTQESGDNFYVGAGDKADALEDTNEVRQILDDLGNLLGHSKRDNLYPEDGTTGGYLGRLNYGLDASKSAVPVLNDMYLATDTVKVYKCFVAGSWVQVYPQVDNVTKTGTFTTGKIAKINNATGIIEEGTNTDTDVADAVTKKHSQNTDQYLDFGGGNQVAVADAKDAVTKKHAQNTDTDLDSTFEATFVKKADTVNVLSDITSLGANIEDAVTKKHTSGSETLVGDVSGTVAANTVNKIKGHTVDETAIGDNKILVYKTTGDKYVYEAKPAAGSTTFLELTDTPGSYGGHGLEILRVNGIQTGVEFSGVAIETTLTVDSDAKVPTSKAVNDFCETTKGYKGKNYYSALGSDHTYSDNADTDSQPVGESVTFGMLLYFNWADKEWKKTDADAAATMPGLRIALETKADGETCLMLVKGYIRDDSAFEFTASMVYASVTPGVMSSTAPTETGDQLQRVGVAKSANILFFDPSIDVGEI